jgi:hypothetical protein
MPARLPLRVTGAAAFVGLQPGLDLRAGSRKVPGEGKQLQLIAALLRTAVDLVQAACLHRDLLLHFHRAW